MHVPSKIEWTDQTWNPVVGCTLVSEGCRNCYAMRQAHRFNGTVAKYAGTTQAGPRGPLWTGRVNLEEAELEKPLRGKKPRRVFVCSMSDLFHPDVPFEFIAEVFTVMGQATQHTYQVLTKRPELMTDFQLWNLGWPVDGYEYSPEREMKETWPNIWLGTSVEDQATADERIPYLLRCPASVRFVSYEPALGPVRFRTGIYSRLGDEAPRGTSLDGIHWMIAGGESGPGARPAHPDWFRSIRDQCQAAGVPFFFKQWGAWRQLNVSDMMELKHRRSPQGLHSWGDGFVSIRVGKKAAGRDLDGRTWDEMPVTELVADGKA